jgi:hypothetical protein
VTEQTEGGPRGGNPHQWPLHKKDLAYIKSFVTNQRRLSEPSLINVLKWFTGLNKLLGYSVPADLRQIFHHHRAGHAGKLQKEDILKKPMDSVRKYSQ